MKIGLMICIIAVLNLEFCHRVLADDELDLVRVRFLETIASVKSRYVGSRIRSLPISSGYCDSSIDEQRIMILMDILCVTKKISRKKVKSFLLSSEYHCLVGQNKLDDDKMRLFSGYFFFNTVKKESFPYNPFSMMSHYLTLDKKNRDDLRSFLGWYYILPSNFLMNDFIRNKKVKQKKAVTEDVFVDLPFAYSFGCVRNFVDPRTKTSDLEEVNKELRLAVLMDTFCFVDLLSQEKLSLYLKSKECVKFCNENKIDHEKVTSYVDALAKGLEQKDFFDSKTDVIATEYIHLEKKDSDKLRTFLVKWYNRLPAELILCDYFN